MSAASPSVSLVKTYEPDSTPALSILVSAGESDLTEMPIDDAAKLYQMLGMVLREARRSELSDFAAEFNAWADDYFGFAMSYRISHQALTESVRIDGRFKQLSDEQIIELLRSWAAGKAVCVKEDNADDCVNYLIRLTNK